MLQTITPYNNSTNLLNKYIIQQQSAVNMKVREQKTDEVIINQKKDKKRGCGIFITVLGFGSSATTGGIAGKFFEKKKIPQLKSKLIEKSENLYKKLCNFDDSSFVTEEGKKNYLEFTRTLFDINKYNGNNEKCLLFEGKDKTSADKIMDWLGNICNKEYKVINSDIDNIGNILATGENLNTIRLFRVENIEKNIKNNAEKEIIKSAKDNLNRCGQESQTILMFHAKDFNELDTVTRASQRITKRFRVDEMKDFDKYADLYKEFEKTEKKLSFVSKITKNKSVVAGIIAGLAVATGIFAILKIKNKKQNVTSNNK